MQRSLELLKTMLLYFEWKQSGDWNNEKDFGWPMFQQPVQKPSSESLKSKDGRNISHKQQSLSGLSHQDDHFQSWVHTISLLMSL